MEPPLQIPLADEPEVMAPVKISAMGMNLVATLIPFHPHGKHCASEKKVIPYLRKVNVISRGQFGG